VITNENAALTKSALRLFNQSMPALDVSRGKTLTFAADGVSINGVIVSSRKAEALFAGVVVETDSPINPGAQLTIPDSDCGGCGVATPQRRGDKTTVELSVRYGCVDASTIGK
jgi:hypothetical protein